VGHWQALDALAVAGAQVEGGCNGELHVVEKREERKEGKNCVQACISLKPSVWWHLAGRVGPYKVLEECEVC
jgi:hypothetical protein